MLELELAIEAATSAGALLRERFGGRQPARCKDNLSSVVTELDLLSERQIVTLLRRHYPEHNLLAEESGLEHHGSAFTWVIDPLDGTSNFAAGIPWYGVMISLFDGLWPVTAAMYLPADDLLYTAEAGRGARRNGIPLRMSGQAELNQVLIAVAADASVDEAATRRQAVNYGRLLNRVRNVRATNCLVDFAFTIDERFGGFVNYSTRVWDIAAAWLVLREAGGRMTDLRGEAIRFSLDADACSRNYGVVGASPGVHAQLVTLLNAPVVA
jgi:myo-inositol-1(or 4)-monophosphatase